MSPLDIFTLVYKTQLRYRRDEKICEGKSKYTHREVYSLPVLPLRPSSIKSNLNEEWIPTAAAQTLWVGRGPNFSQGFYPLEHTEGNPLECTHDHIQRDGRNNWRRQQTKDNVLRQRLQDINVLACPPEWCGRKDGQMHLQNGGRLYGRKDGHMYRQKGGRLYRRKDKLPYGR